MDYIRNTPNGRKIQDRHAATARQAEAQANREMNDTLSKIKDKPKKTVGRYLGGGIAVGIVLLIYLVVTNGDSSNLSLLLIPIIFGPCLFLVIWAGVNASISSFNSENERKREAARKKCQEDKARAWAEAESRTKRDLADYDQQVQGFYKNCRKDALDRMAQYCLDRFHDAMKNAEINAGNTEQYVSFSFTYDVTMTRISFWSNGQILYNMDYDFKAARYRELSTEAECEGLASVLLKMLSSKLKQKYRSQHGQLKSWHEDARVTIQFRIPNKRFIPATAMI